MVVLVAKRGLDTRLIACLKEGREKGVRDGNMARRGTTLRADTAGKHRGKLSEIGEESQERSAGNEAKAARKGGRERQRNNTLDLSRNTGSGR